MSVDEETLKRLDEQLQLLERDVHIARDMLARMRGGFTPASRFASKGTPVPSARIVKQVRDALPEDLLPKLTIVDQGDGDVSIKTTWLEKPDWDRLNAAVLDMGGEWVSAGKDSHWVMSAP